MNQDNISRDFAEPVRAQGGACSPDDYLQLDASEMASLVHRGDLEPLDLLEAALARCDQVNPRVNAVNQRCEARARDLLERRSQADSSRHGLLAGVPMLAKDMHTAVAGTITTNGSRSLRNAPVQTHDATLIKRYETAGMVVFGKTATPEFGLSTTTESALWGKTRNPWNLEMSAGGSSGGAAAAVAAGIVPVAHATDGGGSIRIPASYCGVFGLKPTRYRTPHGPDAFEGWFGASCAHVVSRSVRDSALLLDVSHGHEKGSPYWLAQPERPFVEEVRRTPSRLRVGLVSDSLTGVPLDDDIAAALDATVRLLTGLGHEVEPVTLAVDAQQLFGAHSAASGAALVTAVRDQESALGRALSADELEPVAWHILRNAQQHSAETLYRARRTFERLGLFMEEKFDRYDVLLSPVTATLTPPLGTLSLDQSYENYIAHVVGSVSYTVLANVSGQPSMSIPLATSRAGMPIGMMFTAGLCREGLLFQLAGQLEVAQPWAPFAPTL